MARLNAVSLFAGIGGIDQAFNNLGFNIAWANEIDKYATITYRANFKHNLVEGDIRTIKASEIPQHDILLGGFPCQPWSQAQSKKEKGLDDPRGHLFKEILRVLEYHKPKYFLLENVKGLSNKTNKEAFTQIIEGLEQLGYKVDYKVLNAKYYGVPQNRERIYIIGNLAQKDFKWPEPTNKATQIKDILEQEPVADKYYLSDKAWLGMRERKENGRGSGYSYKIVKETDQATNTLLSRYYKSGNEILIFQNRRGTIRENKENISPTLTSNMGTGGNNQPFILKDQAENPRKLTPRECLRLQGFPETFKIVVSDTQIYKQIGNAVAIPVLEAIATEILRQWEGNN